MARVNKGVHVFEVSIHRSSTEGAVYGAPRDSSYINKRPGRAAPYLHRRIIDSPCLTGS